MNDNTNTAAASQSPVDEAVTKVIEQKEILYKEAQQIAASGDFAEGSSKLSHLLSQWKELRNYRTDRENELWDKFHQAREDFKAARENARAEERKKNAALKEAVIAEAAALLSCENFKEAGEKFSSLMDSWKKIGSAGHDVDEQLWADFNEKRNEFRKLRADFIESQNKKREESKIKKQELIEKTKDIIKTADSDWKSSGAAMNSLMDEWKAAGYAGQECNDSLWEEFNKIRQEYYDARKAAFDAQDSDRILIAQKKEELIQRAVEISNTADYSKENADLMKELDKQWKEAGSAGKERENDLWDRFSKAKESFWDGRHKLIDENNAKWREKAKDIVKSKQKQIDNLYEQCRKLKDSVKGTMDINRKLTVDGWIAEKEAIIEQLKKDIKKLSL